MAGDTIIFRGVTLRNFDVRQGQNGSGTYVNIHMSADFTEPVRMAMKWDPFPAGYKDPKLEGELAGVEMVLKPNSRELASHALQMPIRKVSGFSVVCLKQKDDKPDEHELRFTVMSNSKGAYARLGKWMDNLGEAKAQLKVMYNEGEQPKLDGVEQSPEAAQATLEEND